MISFLNDNCKVNYLLVPGGALIASVASVLISLFWPCGELDHVPVCGMSYHKALLFVWILIYIFVVFLIQDFCKVSETFDERTNFTLFLKPF
jgi:hypothetical protein